MLNKKLLGSVSSPPSDDNFENVTLLLNGDGTNGAQNNTFVDSSTNNFTITRNGNTTQGSFSPYGNLWSNFFNGSSSYLTATNNTAYAFGTGDFCVEAWVFLTSTPSGQMVIGSTYENSSSGFTFSIESNVIKVRLLGDPVVLSGGTTVTANTWNHVAVARSGTSLKVFLNGTEDGSATNSSNVTLNSTAFNIARLTNNTGFLAGYISNLRVVKGSAVYTAAFTPSTTPLTAIANTSLLTCQSNRFIDNSSNNFAITANGSPTVQRFSPFEPTAEYDKAVLGGSIYVDGTTNEALTAPQNTAFEFGTGDFTIEGWAYKTSAAGEMGVGDWRSVAGDQVVPIIAYRNGDVIWYVNGQIRIQATFAPFNCWTHIAVSRISGSTKLFINGVQGGSTYSDSNNYLNPGTVKIAGFINGTSLGYLSDFRVVKGTGLYSTTFTPPTAPLTAVTNTSLLLKAINAGIPDLAMQNNLETVGNAQVSTSVKKYGTGSLAFDGTGDSLLLPSSPLVSNWTGNFTIEGWVYANISSTMFYIWTNSTGNNDGFTGGYIYTDGSVGLGKFGVNQIVTSTGLVTSNTWVHIAFVGDGGTVYLYVNGVSSASGSQATYMSTDVKPLTFGRNYNNTPAFSTGNIDDFRITKGVARYPSGTTFTPPASALPTF